MVPTCDMPEGLVSATVAARYLGVDRRLLLGMARKGIGGSYAVGNGDFRKRWVFGFRSWGWRLIIAILGPLRTNHMSLVFDLGASMDAPKPKQLREEWEKVSTWRTS